MSLAIRFLALTFATTFPPPVNKSTNVFISFLWGGGVKLLVIAVVAICIFHLYN
mgnify:CR=1 FL=1